MGERKYPFFFAFLTTLTVFSLIEFYVTFINNDPESVGVLAIFSSIALILYFSFRAGLRGGFAATGITLGYYLYIISTRHYTGDQLRSALETTAVLGILYFLLSGVIGWLKQTIDILIERETDEKRRLQTIIQQLPVGVLITDQEGRLKQSNKRVSEILGVSIPVGFHIGKDTLHNVTINGKPIVPSQSPLSKSLASGKVITGREIEFQRGGDKNIYLQVSSSPIKNRAGKTIAAASIISDITSQKEAEKRKDDFVNMASHELKTPLTSMKLYLDVLAKQLIRKEDQQSMKIVQSIKLQTDKLQELVSDLLDVTRIQTGKLKFQIERFRIDEMLKETIDALQYITQQKLVLEKLPHVYIYGDRFRLYQVITNLITNAIKYSHEGDIIIRMKKTNDSVVISVKDQGIGIDKSQHKKIFEKLYQVTDDREKTYPGLGMGLYISREIIKRHKGEIWVESEKGKGSTFLFSLPLKKP